MATEITSCLGGVGNRRKSKDLNNNHIGRTASGVGWVRDKASGRREKTSRIICGGWVKDERGTHGSPSPYL